MSAIENLHNRIDLVNIPFTDRGSRIMLFRRDNELYFRLAERWEKAQDRMGHYRMRPPIISHFTLLNAEGEPLAFDVESYPHLARLITASGSFDWIFTDPETLLLHLPEGEWGFQFVAQAEQGQLRRRGGTLRGIRNIAYTTNARLLTNEMSLIPNDGYQIKTMVEVSDGNALLLNITPRLGFNQSLPDTNVEIAAAKDRWEQWFRATPPVLDMYRQQYDYAWWVMRAGLLSQRYFFTREALAPSKIHYVGVWQWDQFFHALAYRHVNTRLAEDQIRIVLDHQRADGMLPDAIHDEGLVVRLAAPVEADVTKPPLAAWAVYKVFEVSHHHDFLEEVYEPLALWHEWWINNNSDEHGLCVYRHPFSSGLDDSPLWDFGMPVTSPDLNTYLCIQQDTLARIAELIGRPEDAARYRDRTVELVQRMLDTLWNEQFGMFLPIHNGEFIQVITPFSLLPLWTNRLPDAVKSQLLNHLTNPATFWTEFPLATVSVSDPTFNPFQMWRGPSWPNINYLLVEALTDIGEKALAGKLRRKTLDMIARRNDIYEYYNPLTGESPPKAAPIFGWTSAVFIDLAIQESRLSLK
jgi:glycogen debranching enzyme